MTTTKKSTKIAAIVLTLAMLVSVFCIAGTVSANAAADKVSLYSSSVTFSKYGASTYEIFVQTKDNAADQKVYVHYNYLDGYDWRDAEATYTTTLSDGSKIWKAVFSSYNTKYAIKYVADGNTYWDNNNGNDYDGSNIIGSAPVASQRLGYQYTPFNGYKVNAVLQNYAYNKEVFVRYTTDGWNFFKDQQLGYSTTNADGTETWTTTLNEDLSGLGINDFQYAICYKVNGNEYWANNFGANYNRSFQIHQ